jgi:hypothetical protein
MSDETDERMEKIRKLQPDSTLAGQKADLPKDLMGAINGPMDMAMALVSDGMNSIASVEECDANEIRMRGVWHALHYVTRRLSGWDTLPQNNMADGIAWEHKTEDFKRLAAQHEARPTLRQMIEQLENDRDTTGSLMEPKVPLDVRNEVLKHLNEAIALLDSQERS